MQCEWALSCLEFLEPNIMYGYYCCILILQVVPEYEKQEWGGKNKYAGIFHFQFYRFG